MVSPNAFLLNFHSTRCRAKTPITRAADPASPPPESAAIFAIAAANAAGVASHKKPVTPFATLSFGPPLSHAITGFPAAIASKGTIPKCSFEGVYNTHVHFSSNARFVSLLTETLNSTSRATPSAFASASSAARYSTHSRRRASYPPARISLEGLVESSRNIANARRASSRFFLRSNRFTDKNAISFRFSKLGAFFSNATAGYTTAGCAPFL